jgi:hypothetical protein
LRTEQWRDARGHVRQRGALDRDHDEVLRPQHGGVGGHRDRHLDLALGKAQPHPVRLERSQRRAARDGAKRMALRAEPRPDKAADGAGAVDADFHDDANAFVESWPRATR